MNEHAERNQGDNVEELYEWIDQIPFSRPKKNIPRDFSDAVLMAEVLKIYYPRHVDVHNYIAASGVAMKRDNWGTLNRKVLSKIDMKLSKEVINQLANSQQGTIEKVLLELRAKILKDCNPETESLNYELEQADKAGIEQSRPDDEDSAQFDHAEDNDRTVSRHVYVRLKHELHERNDAIGNLTHKVAHLESLMKIKDHRIAELTAQIPGPMEFGQTPRPHVIGSSLSKLQKTRPNRIIHDPRPI